MNKSQQLSKLATSLDINESSKTGDEYKSVQAFLDVDGEGMGDEGSYFNNKLPKVNKTLKEILGKGPILVINGDDHRDEYNKIVKNASKLDQLQSGRGGNLNLGEYEGKPFILSRENGYSYIIISK